MHRIYPLWFPCAVYVHLFAPYTSSAAFLYGVLSHFCTAHILCDLPVRCSFTFSHRTHSLWPSCTVHVHLFAPHTTSAAFLCGARSLFCTAHFLWGLPVRCTFTFSHRTHSPQPSCAVHFHLSTPYTSSAAFLCGAHSPFRTAHFLYDLPVRCTFPFLHRTLPLWTSCAVHFLFSAPHTFSVAFLCGALSLFCTAHILRNLPVR